MKPSAFDYIRVETLDEALSLLTDSELEAKILAGGHSLVPMLNMRRKTGQGSTLISTAGSRKL